MLTLIATLSLDLMSATSHDKPLSGADAPCVTAGTTATGCSVNAESSVTTSESPIQVTDERDPNKESVNDAMGLFTAKNILISVGGLTALLLVLALLRNMIRVR